jgi:LCP family protein required for cell wall assembly
MIGAVLATALVGGVALAAIGPGGRPVRAQSAGPSPSASAVELHAVHGASFVPALEGKRPLFVLALGSDARPGQVITAERSDSIHIIGIDLVRHRATILGFPRDSWVSIPGHGMGKITTAMALGGPSLTIRTIETLTGIPIDFWLLTAFAGFRAMVGAIGGLTVDVQQTMDDQYSGAHFSKGIHHLNPHQALSFARDRHDFLSGDLTRSANQGRLLVAALDKLHTVFGKDPGLILRWMGALYRSVHTDLPFSTLLQLALTTTTIPVAHVNNLVVPATVGTEGTQSVVFISPSARSIYADLRADGVVGSP